MNLTIAIASNHPTHQLIRTIRSIRNCRGCATIPIIVLCDTLPISKSLGRQLRNYSVSYYELSSPAGFATKCKALLQYCQTSHILFTQDDVVFHREAIALIYQAFKSPMRPTFVGARNIPIPPTSMLESAISMGTLLSNRIAHTWRNGDNYMACVGRVMAFPISWVQQLDIPANVVSLDAYLYLENKRKGGSYFCQWSARIYFKTPSTLAEHLAKSSRFQYSKLEMNRHGFNHLDHEYAVPIGIALTQLATLFLRFPIKTLLYLAIFTWTKVFKKTQKESLVAAWEVEASTKSW